MVPIALLRRVPYFARLDDEALAAVARCAVQRRYQPGKLIFLEGDPCAGLFLVQEGRVRIYKSSLQGRELSLHFVEAGGSFNDVAVLDGGPNPASVQAVDAAVCWVIDRPSMLRLVERYPALAIAVIESIASRTRHLLTLVEDLTFRSVQARLAKLLLEQASAAAAADDATPGGRWLTQQEMAARLGTVREVVGRALKGLEAQGFIRLDRHRIVIVDRAGLEEQALL